MKEMKERSVKNVQYYFEVRIPDCNMCIVTLVLI